MTDGATRTDRLRATLDDVAAPPPLTMAQRLPIALGGGLAIVAATGILVWALSGDHAPISARAELGAAGAARRPAVVERPAPRRPDDSAPRPKPE